MALTEYSLFLLLCSVKHVSPVRVVAPKLFCLVPLISCCSSGFGSKGTSPMVPPTPSLSPISLSVSLPPFPFVHLRYERENQEKMGGKRQWEKQPRQIIRSYWSILQVFFLIISRWLTDTSSVPQFNHLQNTLNHYKTTARHKGCFRWQDNSFHVRH